MIYQIETIAPLVGSVMQPLAHASYHCKLRYPVVSTTTYEDYEAC